MQLTDLAGVAFFCFAVFQRCKGIVASLKEHNRGRLKAELLFLGITIGVAVLLLLVEGLLQTDRLGKDALRGY